MCLFRTFYTFHSQKFFPRFFQHLSKFMQKPDFCCNSMNDINKISTIFRTFSRVTHKFSQTFFSELVNRFLHIFIQVHLGFQPGISSEIRLGIPSRYFVSKYSKNWQFFLEISNNVLERFFQKILKELHEPLLIFLFREVALCFI